MRILPVVVGLCFSLHAVFGSVAMAEEETAVRPVLRVFGPYDPLLAVREIADRFEAKNNVKVEVTGAAPETWKAQATKEGDVVFSGSESMMEDFSKNLGIVDEKTIQTFYLRAATLLVRPGNPQGIKGIKDVLRKNMKVMVVRGADQNALWEDVVGKLKDAEAINVFRKRIVYSAPDSGAAEKYWANHEDVDAWLTLNSWGKDTPANANVIGIERDLLVYRSIAAAVTTTTTERELSLKFLKFLNSSQAERVFKAHGWFRKESDELKLR